MGDLLVAKYVHVTPSDPSISAMLGLPFRGHLCRMAIPGRRDKWVHDFLGPMVAQVLPYQGPLSGEDTIGYKTVAWSYPCDGGPLVMEAP